MATLTISVPDEPLKELDLSTGELAEEVRLAAAIEWFRQGWISQGRAAELAGITRADFLTELANRKIENVDVDMAELAREMEETSCVWSGPDLAQGQPGQD